MLTEKKKCAHAQNVKSGKAMGKQRYKCKLCHKVFIPREPHPLAFGGDGYETIKACLEIGMTVDLIRGDLKMNGLVYSYEIVRRFVRQCKNDMEIDSLAEDYEDSSINEPSSDQAQ